MSEIRRKFEYRESIIDVGKDNTHGGGVSVEGFAVIGLILPTLDNGNITFEVSMDGQTWFALKKLDGTVVTLTAGTGGFAVSTSDLDHLAAYRYVRPVTVAQTADRTLIFVLKG